MRSPGAMPEPGAAGMAPALSVILVTEEGGRSLDRILDRLAAQTIAGSLEVLVGAADPDAVAIRPEHLGAFRSLRVLRADTVTSATARAAAIRAATAPFVALAEDHCFPESDRWAERLVRGLAAGHGAVGPVMRNANPGTRISWANLLVEYGPWLSADRAGEQDYLPGHNSAYRHALLLDYGDSLADMLEAEWVMHADLRRKGETLLLDPGIEAAHLNYSLVGRSFRLHALAGRMFASSRARDWSRGRKLAFALLSPAIPLKRCLSVTRDAIRAGDARRPLVASLPMAYLLLVASGIGEGLGYAFGDGGRRNALAQLEYRRWRNLRSDELHLAR